MSNASQNSPPFFVAHKGSGLLPKDKASVCNFFYKRFVLLTECFKLERLVFLDLNLRFLAYFQIYNLSNKEVSVGQFTRFLTGKLKTKDLYWSGCLIRIGKRLARRTVTKPEGEDRFGNVKGGVDVLNNPRPNCS